MRSRVLAVLRDVLPDDAIVIAEIKAAVGASSSDIRVP